MVRPRICNGGTDAAGSIGFDDNAFASNVVLDGTTVSGFETGVLKTSGELFLKGGSSMTAGTNGYGVMTDGIVVRAVDAAVDGGTLVQVCMSYQPRCLGLPNGC